MIKQISVTQTIVQLDFAKIGKCPWGFDQASSSDSPVSVHSAGPSGFWFGGKNMFLHGWTILGYLNYTYIRDYQTYFEGGIHVFKKSTHWFFIECLKNTS